MLDFAFSGARQNGRILRRPESNSGVEERARRSELRLLVQYAALDLSPMQAYAVQCWLDGLSIRQAAACSPIRVSPQAIWQAQQAAIEVMRRRLADVGVFSEGDIL